MIRQKIIGHKMKSQWVYNLETIFSLSFLKT